MKLLEVIPISKAISKESLSYFSSEDAPLGSVVSIPLRSKTTKAIVVGSKNVSSDKARLRKENYSIKKVVKSKPQKIFLPEFIESVKALADFSASSTGSALYSLIPKLILEDGFKIISEKSSKITSKKNGIHEKYVIQSLEEERFANYRGIIREQIAKNQSTFLITPTTKVAENLFGKIKKGIDTYCYLLHSSMKKKELLGALEEILFSDKPVVVVATGNFLAIPRNDVGAIILEKESSQFYKQKSRPFTDLRMFVEIFSKNIKAKLYVGDLYLRTETLWRMHEGEFVELVPAKSKFVFSSDQKIVDMKSRKKGQTDSLKGFKIVGPDLEKTIKESQEKKEKIFLFCARKGLNPVTICGDCGAFVECQRCGAPLVLHSHTSKSQKKNFFLCHKCGRSREAETRCSNCQSWKLTPMGIGIEFIEKRVKENFKEAEVFRLDGDIASTPAKANRIIKDFNESEAGILVGTEMALNYIEKVSYSGIVSLDSFFSIPDFRISEKIINLVFSIKEKTEKTFIMQTRNIEQDIMKFIKEGNLNDFYREEIKQREDFGFPPFFHFIKISFSGTKPALIKESKKLKSFFDGYDVSVYPSFVSGKRSVVNVLIRVEREKWPDSDLREKILALPQKFSVDVNSDNLL